MSAEAKSSTRRKLSRRGKPRSAAKQMIWLAGAGLFAITIYNALQADEDVGPLWRVFVGIAACLYLWWLAAMLFDLVFVWHRYLRHAVALEFLRKEVQRADLSPKGDSPHQPRPTSPNKNAGGDDDFLSDDDAQGAKKPKSPTVTPGLGAMPVARPEDREQPMGQA
jgi:hypothetical protein